jgi:hypothetical protein
MIWNTSSDEDDCEMAVFHLANAPLCILVFAFDCPAFFNDDFNLLNSVIGTAVIGSIHVHFATRIDA